MLARTAILLAAVIVGGAGCAAPQSSEERQNSLILLGQQLFHDRGLSVDGTISCASCHQPNRAFSDDRSVALGAHGRVGTRNAPSLLDVQVMSTFFWDGRATKLEDVVLQPFTNRVEMGLRNSKELVRLVQQKDAYQELMRQAFGDRTVTESKMKAALSAYLRALPIGRTRYERHMVTPGANLLNHDERAGLDLFIGKAECNACHQISSTPPSFADNRFHHTGIGFDKVAGNITGMVDKLTTLEQQGLPLGQLILENPQIAELGRFATTRVPSDLGAFRTPSLRNVARTAPYMHDGSVNTLELAVERELYYRGLARGRPISLTVDEQRQLIAFLSTLNTGSDKVSESAPSLTAH